MHPASKSRASHSARGGQTRRPPSVSWPGAWQRETTERIERTIHILNAIIGKFDIAAIFASTFGDTLILRGQSTGQACCVCLAGFPTAGSRASQLPPVCILQTVAKFSRPFATSVHPPARFQAIQARLYSPLPSFKTN